MSNVQIRNVPDDLHRRLRARAALEGTSVSELLLRELESFLDRPSKQAILARIASREPAILTESAADAVQAGRREA